MNATQALRICVLIVLMLILIRRCKMAAFCKMTNAVCESSNKSWVIIDKCRLRAISRNKTTFNADINILYPVYNIHLRLQLMKKDNGYKPWLFNYTIDGCVFMRQQRHPVFKMFWLILRDFSTINHTCPYQGNQIVKDFYYDPTNLTLPLPTGDYLLLLTWIFDKKPQFVTNIYFSFYQDLF